MLDPSVECSSRQGGPWRWLEESTSLGNTLQLPRFSSTLTHMIRVFLISLGFAALTTGCAPASRTTPPATDATATSHSPRRDSEAPWEFVQSHYAARPAAGSALGLHEWDGRFWIPDRNHLAEESRRLQSAHDRFSAAISRLEPTSSRCRELRLLETVIAGEQLQLEGIRAPFRNPMYYASALDVSLYLKRDWKPLVERVKDMTAILKQSPALFGAARDQLEPVLPKPWVETAIEIAEATAGFLENEVLSAGRECGDSAVVNEFATAVRTAARECRDYAVWIRTHRLPSATPEFAIGRTPYARLLATEMIDLPPERILAIGLEELKAEEARFNSAAREIDPAQPPAEVFKRIQRDHPTAANLIPDTRRNLESIRQFLIDRHIVTLPSSVRAQVTETLPPFRATSFASMDTPGPFETRATQAYYYVTPVDPQWPPAQQEEWLTAFNYYTTDVVSIHEAYPGHYIQFLALNASRATPVEKAFYSYAFAEGWAHYSEQMLLSEGFAQPRDPSRATPTERIRAASYRLAQSDEALLRVCRLCASVQMHCFGMSLDQATQFFIEHCHYAPKPARQEALRGTFDPGYCFYTLGKLQFLKLREDWKRQEGAAYTLQRFHDEALRHGAPPLRLLREAMLKDPRIHGDLF